MHKVANLVRIWKTVSISAKKGLPLTSASVEDFGLGRGAFSPFNIRDTPIEGVLMNDGRHEIAEIINGACLDALHCFNQTVSDDRPKGLRDIHSGASGTFLALIFKGRANRLVNNVRDIRARMNEMHVLATGLTDNSREIPIGL
jgi:hypothetical protein